VKVIGYGFTQENIAAIRDGSMARLGSINSAEATTSPSRCSTTSGATAPALKPLVDPRSRIHSRVARINFSRSGWTPCVERSVPAFP
jgi:hypothetical protein